MLQHPKDAGPDVVVDYLPGNDEFAEGANWVINRLVENDIKSLPEDFLEYHQATMSPYRGMRGEIVETEEYATAEECVTGVIAKLQAELVARRSSAWSFSTTLQTPTSPRCD